MQQRSRIWYYRRSRSYDSLVATSLFRRDETRRAYNFYFSPEYDWYGEAIQFEKDRSFHIKMTDADSDWNPTIFGFDLIEVDNGTRVQFFHKDWPKCNHHYRRSSYCSALLLKGLKDYVERGIILPFEDRA